MDKIVGKVKKQIEKAKKGNQTASSPWMPTDKRSTSPT